MKLRAIIFLAIFLSLNFCIPSGVTAETQSTGSKSQEVQRLEQQIAEKRNKIKQLEDSIERVKNQISTKRLQAVSLSNQMAILDNRITQVGLDINLTEEKLASLQLEIEQLQADIDLKEKLIKKEKLMLGELIRTLNYQNTKGVVEILAVYDRVSDFYNNLQFLKSVEQDLGRTAKAIRIAKESLKDKHKNTEERKNAYADLKIALVDKKQDLDEQVFAKQNLLAETHSSELTYKVLLSNLRKQYQDIEDEVSNIEQQVRKRLEEEKKLQTLDTGGSAVFVWPVPSKYVVAYFHDPDYPFRHVFEHSGLDIRAGQGTAVRAAGAGYIARAKKCLSASCYSYVMIIHGDGLSTLYGHLSNIGVSEDQFVTKGDIIGYSGGMPGTVGAGPFVTGPHLHFEVRKNGIPINPLPYLPNDYSTAL